MLLASSSLDRVMTSEQNIHHGSMDGWQQPHGSLAEYLLRRLHSFGDKILQEYPADNKNLTAEELTAQSKLLAAALYYNGINRGDVVVFCCRSNIHFSPLMLATLAVGATCAPLNPDYDVGDLERLLSNLQPRLVFAVQGILSCLKNILKSINSTAKIIEMGTGDSWENFLTSVRNKDFHVREIENVENHNAFIMCSSGTTGLPKGVQLSHGNFHAYLQMMRYKEGALNGNDTVLIGSPVFWISNILFQMLSLDAGTKLIILDSFQEELYLTTIQKYKASSLFSSPSSLIALAKYPAVSKYNLTSLRYICCGGSAMNEKMQLLVEKKFSTKVSQWYGMTEILVTLGCMKTEKRKPGSVGTLVPYMSCKIIDTETGQAVGTKKMGELCFKGPFVTKGYYKNSTATSAAIDKDGWLHTGDIAYSDEDGFFFIVDRIKELIKYRGEHVAPAELEALLVSHPAVKEVAVIGIPHDLDQEHPCAFVIKQPGSTITEQELVNLVQDGLATHKWLRGGVYFVDFLPKSATGKYKRNELRNMFQSTL